jgi:hypothetical protein
MYIIAPEPKFHKDWFRPSKVDKETHRQHDDLIAYFFLKNKESRLKKEERKLRVSSLVLTLCLIDI